MGQLQSQQNSETSLGCTGCMMSVDEPNIQWRSYLKQELQELQINSTWAMMILKQIGKIPKQAIYHFTRQITDEFTSLTVNVQSVTKSVSYRNSLHSSLSNQRELDIPDDQITDIIRNSTLINEQTLMQPKQQDVEESFKSFKSFKSSVGSQASSTPSYICYQKNNSVQINKDQITILKQQIEFYTKITKIIKLHIHNKTHQLNYIRQKFIELHISCESIYDIQQFSRVFVGTLMLYYDLQTLTEGRTFASLLNQQNLLNFVVSTLVETPILYNWVYNHYKESYRERIQVLTEVFKLQLNIAQCEVSQSLTLDESVFKDRPDQNNQPYAKSIKIMRFLQMSHSPTSKYKVLMRLSESIMDCIKEFYDYHGLQFNQLIEPEDMMGILSYILRQSGLSDINVHLEIIQNFTTNELLMNTIGYYLISLKAISDQLEEQYRKNK